MTMLIDPIKIILTARQEKVSVQLTQAEIFQVLGCPDLDETAKNVWFLIASLTAHHPQLSCQATYPALAAKLNITTACCYQAMGKLQLLDFIIVTPDDSPLYGMYGPQMPEKLRQSLGKERDYTPVFPLELFEKNARQVFCFTLNMSHEGLLVIKKSACKAK